MGRFFVALLLVAAFSLGAAISYYNWMAVRFHYLAGEIEVPLIALLLGAFAMGALVTWLLNLARVFALRRESRRQERQIRELEAELRNLRDLPLQQTTTAAAPTPAKNA